MKFFEKLIDNLKKFNFKSNCTIFINFYMLKK